MTEDTKSNPTERRRVMTGTVVSDKMDKTAVVRVDRVYKHAKFKKIIRRSKKYHCHDEGNQCKPGDFVEIRETRPLSKLKRWCLVRIIKQAEVIETPAASKVAS